MNNNKLEIMNDDLLAQVDGGFASFLAGLLLLILVETINNQEAAKDGFAAGYGK